MKKALPILLSILIASVINYTFVAFVEWNPYPSQWSEAGRAWFGMFTSLIALLFYVFKK